MRHLIEQQSSENKYQNKSYEQKTSGYKSRNQRYDK